MWHDVVQRGHCLRNGNRVRDHHRSGAVWCCMVRSSPHLAVKADSIVDAVLAVHYVRFNCLL
jgi:hypothetical protein